MQERPNIVLKRKWLAKGKKAVIFQRNNLSFKDFKRIDTGYVYEGSFNHNGVSGIISLFVDSDNLQDIFSINTKTIKIKGGKNHFGVLFRFPDQEKMPLDKAGKNMCIRYKLHCEGQKLFYEKKKKSGFVTGIHSTSRIRFYSAPAYMSWAVSHPYQGGGFSPR